MNKIVLPALLVATVMVAGAFAFVPVEQASTVHASGILTTTAFVADTIEAGDIATDAIGALELADNSVALANMLDSSVSTTEVVDGSIGPEDVTGVTSATGLFHLEEQSDTDAAVSTTAFTPVETSVAIVTCTVEGLVDADMSTGILTLSTDEGAIQQQAAVNLTDTLNGDTFAGSATWVVTGLTASTTFTCTAGGGGVTGADVTGIQIIALFMPTA